jgi:hypothetical protein
MKNIASLFTVLLLTACGGGGGSNDSPPAPAIPSQGTVLEESCSGTTLIQTIADGNGGSTQEETPNSPQCGYVAPPAEGTILDEFCEDTTKVIITADGNGGEVRSEEEKSEDCGYVGPPAEGTPDGDSYCAYILEDDTEKLDIVAESINHLVRQDRLQDYHDGEGGIYTDRLVHIDETCFVQMEKPADCPTDYSPTDDSRFDYVTCDGVKQKSSVSFPFDKQDTGLAIIDMLVVFDTNLTEEDRDGMTVEEFVDKQVWEANHIYISSGLHTVVRVADIKMVEVAAGDLYRQYTAFFNGRYEFNGLDDWQREADADIAFLFKKRPENGIACGVASLDATRGLDKTRGITQCFHNSTFQSTETTRYYERAPETFAHEIGHLLGAQHVWEDADTPGIFEYSFGYNLPGYNPQEGILEYTGAYGGYGTIMSYADLATGMFSNYELVCQWPEEAGSYAGQSVRMGTRGGCFCLDPIEDQPPPTNNAETIKRTRWIMSQLHEVEHGLQFSPFTNMQMDGLTLEEDPEICLF